MSRPSNFKVTLDTNFFDPKLVFRTVTPIWIHPWLWNDAQSLMQYRIGSLLFFKVIQQISGSRGLKNPILIQFEQAY